MEQLLTPIPDFTDARTNRDGYREYPLDHNDPRNGEELVDIRDYGLAGQSYYSRPNNATGAALAEAPTVVLVRASIATKLAEINHALQNSTQITALFEGRLELYVDEGLRPFAVQKIVYEEAVPRIIRAQNPQMSEHEVLALRDRRIAKPAHDEFSPPPHATGAAVDIKLRYLQTERGFVPNTFVPTGHNKTSLGALTHPDYYEHFTQLTSEDKIAQRNRRIFHNVMLGLLNDAPSGLSVNPYEWWHWSYGDQMWAKTTNQPTAFYGFPKE